MLENKTIGVVIPAYNEEILIKRTIDTLPDFVDFVIPVNDCSTDETGKILDEYKRNWNKKSQFVAIHHEKNQGVGAAIATGYLKAIELEIDVSVVVAGDAQMNPDNMYDVVMPVCTEEVDYTKGNRLIHGEAWKQIPRVRYIGNSVLSLLTKIASGYWHIADSQTGYTAISLKALKAIDVASFYPRYGIPNDILIRLNVEDFKIKDVPVDPVYNIGEKSGIKIRKVIFTISYLLLKGFLWRMKEKYIIRDFHPLIFYYFLSFVIFCLEIIFSVRLVYLYYKLQAMPEITFTLCLFLAFSGLQTLFFGMWLDMDRNKELKG